MALEEGQEVKVCSGREDPAVDSLRAANKQLEDEDDAVFFDPSLFICTSYKVKEYEVGDIRQSLLCSTAASTDHDLTGQVVWPVSIFLSWFVVHHRALFEGKDVLELGAGCGLSGLVSSRFARRTLLTDGNATVVDLLEQNAARQREEHEVEVEAVMLEWGCGAEETDRALTTAGRERMSPQILLGADVVCWPDAVQPLVTTVHHLLHMAPDPTTAALYLGLVVRATSVERLFRRCVEECGMRVRTVMPESFLPVPRPENTVSNLELHLLVVDLGLGGDDSLSEGVAGISDRGSSGSGGDDGGGGGGGGSSRGC